MINPILNLLLFEITLKSAVVEIVVGYLWRQHLNIFWSYQDAMFFPCGMVPFTIYTKVAKQERLSPSIPSIDMHTTVYAVFICFPTCKNDLGECRKGKHWNNRTSRPLSLTVVDGWSCKSDLPADMERPAHCSPVGVERPESRRLEETFYALRSITSIVVLWSCTALLYVARN